MKTNEAPDERVLFPKSFICLRCHARIDTAQSWDVVQCPCGYVTNLSWRER